MNRRSDAGVWGLCETNVDSRPHRHRRRVVMCGHCKTILARPKTKKELQASRKAINCTKCHVKE